MASDKNALLALIANLYPDNSTQAITPAKLRQGLEEMIASDLNLQELTTQITLGLVNMTEAQKGGVNLITGVKEVDLLSAFSLATDQLPSALSTPLQVEFGAAQALTDVSIDAAGVVTFNTPGDYIVKTELNKGRAAGTGTALLFSRTLFNTVQIGQSGAARITDTDSTIQYNDEHLVTAEINDTLTVEIVRDSTGDDSGGLISETSADGWNLSPSALITVSRYEGVS